MLHELAHEDFPVVDGMIQIPTIPASALPSMRDSSNAIACRSRLQALDCLSNARGARSDSLEA
jgi:hypothetical protein